MLVKVDSAALHGIEGVVVSVEVDVSRGFLQPDAAARRHLGIVSGYGSA